MPILSRRSSLPRSALMRVIASRIRSAAASARSGVENVAITASPIVLTTAILDCYLLRRTASGVMMTPEGEAFLPLAELARPVGVPHRIAVGDRHVAADWCQVCYRAPSQSRRASRWLD